MSNSHLVLHKETLKQHFEKYTTSIKHLIKIINLGAINCPVGRNGLSWTCSHLSPSHINNGAEIFKIEK